MSDAKGIKSLLGRIGGSAKHVAPDDLKIVSDSSLGIGAKKTKRALVIALAIFFVGAVAAVTAWTTLTAKKNPFENGAAHIKPLPAVTQNEVAPNAGQPAMAAADLPADRAPVLPPDNSPATAPPTSNTPAVKQSPDQLAVPEPKAIPPKTVAARSPSDPVRDGIAETLPTEYADFVDKLNRLPGDAKKQNVERAVAPPSAKPKLVIYSKNDDMAGVISRKKEGDVDDKPKAKKPVQRSHYQPSKSINDFRDEEETIGNETPKAKRVVNLKKRPPHNEQDDEEGVTTEEVYVTR